MNRLLCMCCLAAIVTVGCGQAPNDLWGSIEASFPLDFDRTEILRQNADLIIQYLKKIPGGTQKVVKIVVETENLTIGNNSDLRDEIFATHVTLERIASTQSEFPPIEGGQLHFEKYHFEEGGRIDGDFTIVFDNGRNLLGTFDGNVKIISTL